MSNDQLEPLILESLQQLKKRYAQIEQLTNDLSKLDPASPDFRQLHGRIQMELAEVETLQAQSRSHFDQYVQSREHASPTVRQLSDELTKTIQELIVKFSKIESEARDTQKKLEPLVNQNLRIAKMKSAYRRHTV